MTKAPAATPQMLPMPPRTTIARTVKLTVKPNCVGETMASLELRYTPARPDVEAPMAKASSLVVTVLMPMLAAASSSSRMAIQARPSRESCSRYSRTMATAMIAATVM